MNQAVGHFVLVAFLLMGSDLIGQSNQPNILWITCEDISPAWGCYGDDQATTPNIDRIAASGYRFAQAFSNAPICAPARSTLITGIYATSLGTQHLRSEIPVPVDLKILPEILRDAGYFTSNNAKTDYNFSTDGRWDDLGGKAHWKNRPEDQPFFSVFNFGITHEGHANSDNPEDTKSLASKHDPEKMVLPPYYPDTEEFRSIMAHQYDLISVFDQEVGRLVKQLEEDNLEQETIIFIFSDHGYGLPRYKRWLYNTGLQVPFVLYVPEKYRDNVSNLKKNVISEMVSFVDFAPSTLKLAGCEIPDRMEGTNFLGPESSLNKFVFGFRDRADDVYDMSRSIYDGQYLFIRNFMPHKAYIQDALIFDRDKRSFAELKRLKVLGQLTDESLKMFQAKPVEELYDLENDPDELSNLINDTQYRDLTNHLRKSLFEHLRNTYDTGLMNEGDMMERAKNHSVYEVAKNSSRFDIDRTIEVMAMVGQVFDPYLLLTYLRSHDAAVRYWALVAFDAYEGNLDPWQDELANCTDDPSLVNRVLAAEILIKRFHNQAFISVMEDGLSIDSEPVLLQVAISVRNIGAEAKPLIDLIKEKVYPRIAGDIWGKYKNWSYPMFIGMALDKTIEHCED